MEKEVTTSNPKIGIKRDVYLIYHPLRKIIKMLFEEPTNLDYLKEIFNDERISDCKDFLTLMKSQSLIKVDNELFSSYKMRILCFEDYEPKINVNMFATIFSTFIKYSNDTTGRRKRYLLTEFGYRRRFDSYQPYEKDPHALKNPPLVVEKVELPPKVSEKKSTPVKKVEEVSLKKPEPVFEYPNRVYGKKKRVVYVNHQPNRPPFRDYPKKRPFYEVPKKVSEVYHPESQPRKRYESTHPPRSYQSYESSYPPQRYNKYSPPYPNRYVVPTHPGPYEERVKPYLNHPPPVEYRPVYNNYPRKIHDRREWAPNRNNGGYYHPPQESQKNEYQNQQYRKPPFY